MFSICRNIPRGQSRQETPVDSFRLGLCSSICRRSRVFLSAKRSRVKRGCDIMAANDRNRRVPRDEQHWRDDSTSGRPQ